MAAHRLRILVCLSLILVSIIDIENKCVSGNGAENFMQGRHS